MPVVLEQPPQVRVGGACDRLRTRPAQPGELDSHSQRGRGLVAPIGSRPEIGSVGLDQDRVIRKLHGRGARSSGGAEADRQRERHQKATRGEGSRHLRVAREAVQHPRDRSSTGRRSFGAIPHPREKRADDRLVRVPIVHEDRLANPSREVELSGESVALDVWRREIAEEVEPDLTDGSDPRIAGQRLEACPGCLIGLAGVVRMDPDSRSDQLREPLTQMQRRLGAREVPAGDEDADDSSLLSSIDDRLAIVVECGVLQVAMRVDESRKCLRCAMARQVATPGDAVSRIGSSGGVSSSEPPSSGSSVRGKSGSARPVCQPSGPAPQVRSVASPGPPAPRAS